MDMFVRGLHTALQALSSVSRVIAVLGNEACDLDSAVSAHVYSYYLHEINSDSCNPVVVLPILNVRREDLLIKTEVKFCFEKLGIDLKDVLCYDDVDISAFQDKLELVLVDHNVLASKDKHLEPYVTSVIDHHVRERKEPPKERDHFHLIEPVGSCATLVAEKIWKTTNFFELDSISLQLLRWTILTDTANLSPIAKKTTPKDVEVLEKLESLLNLSPDKRTDDFEMIRIAKNDTSSFSVAQLLKRDLKIVDCGSVTIAIPSIPILASRMAEKVNFLSDMQSFLTNGGYDCVAVMGIQVGTGSVERDILLYPASNPVTENVKQQLLADADLQMKRKGNIAFKDVECFEQSPAYSRKKVLPMIKCLFSST